MNGKIRFPETTAMVGWKVFWLDQKTLKINLTIYFFEVSCFLNLLKTLAKK